MSGEGRGKRWVQGASIRVCLSEFCPSVYTSTDTHPRVQMCESFAVVARVCVPQVTRRAARFRGANRCIRPTKTHLCESPQETHLSHSHTEACLTFTWAVHGPNPASDTCAHSTALSVTLLSARTAAKTTVAARAPKCPEAFESETDARSRFTADNASISSFFFPLALSVRFLRHKHVRVSRYVEYDIHDRLYVLCVTQI